MTKKLAFILTIISGLLIAGCSSNEDGAFEVPFDGSIEHVHGMGYAGDNNGLYIASHTGLKIYRDGEWYETSKNFNDYMGFNAVNEGFYTSGHPGEDSDLPNPIGIQRSFDGGKTLESLDFEGETDFHAMAVGYDSHDIFLKNPAKNSELEVGFYRSSNDGGDWESVSAKGLDGDVLSLALHPTNSNLVAAATSAGIHLSKDGGENFQLLTDGNVIGTAVFFNDENLYYATFGTSAELINFNVEDGTKEALNLPKLNEDGLNFLAQNPQNSQQFSIYTVKGQAYMSKDAAKSWEQILENGKVN